MTDQVPLLLTVPFVMIRNVVIQNRFLARFRSFQQVLIFKYFKYLCPVHYDAKLLSPKLPFKSGHLKF